MIFWCVEGAPGTDKDDCYVNPVIELNGMYLGPPAKHFQASVKKIIK